MAILLTPFSPPSIVKISIEFDLSNADAPDMACHLQRQPTEGSSLAVQNSLYLHRLFDAYVTMFLAAKKVEMRWTHHWILVGFRLCDSWAQRSAEHNSLATPSQSLQKNQVLQSAGSFFPVLMPTAL